jgi:hypothetical protein
MMFLVWSMICWGRSIEAERGHLFALLAGILWRLGILAKTFLFLSAFPIIAVWIYDRLTTKRIDWSCVALPALGGVGVLGAWYGVVNHFSYLVPDEISTLFLYRHYLMFGIPSTLNGLMWFLQQPVYLVGLIGIVWFTVTYLFRGKMNPALLVLLMTAELYLFWWLFFTPSTISRYTWYSCAILGIFSGPALLQGVELVRSSATGRARKIGVAIVCGAILLSAGFRLIEQLDLIYVKDEAWDERNLAAHMRTIPENTVMATGYWPLSMNMDFMTGRRVDGIEDLSQIDDKYEVIIYNVEIHPLDPEVLENSERFGRYAVVHRDRK